MMSADDFSQNYGDKKFEIVIYLFFLTIFEKNNL